MIRLLRSFAFISEQAQRLPIVETTKRGTKYAIGLFIGSSYLEIDKILILQLVGADAVGAYTVAFRVVSIFLLPILALMGAATSRLYASGGSVPGLRLQRSLAITSVAYAAAASLCAYSLAPAMPVIFGDEFSASSAYVKMLAPWIVLFGLHQYAGICLTVSGRQPIRSAIEVVGVALIVLTNMLLLPQIGPLGAVVALIGGEIFMAVSCWAALRAGQHVKA